MSDRNTHIAPPGLCTPGVRTVVVFACGSRGPDGTVVPEHEVLPVLAIMATHGEGGDPVVEPLVVGPVGLGDPGQLFSPIMLDGYGSFRVVPCPWSPEEDAERLAPVIRRLEAMAVAAMTPSS